MLIDVVSGEITATRLEDAGAPTRLRRCRCATASWRSPMRATSIGRLLPEAPSGLTARSSGGGVALQWISHGTSKAAIERRAGNDGKWERIATQASGDQFTDAAPPRGVVCYRVRALNDAGESAFSNITSTDSIGGNSAE